MQAPDPRQPSTAIDWSTITPLQSNSSDLSEPGSDSATYHDPGSVLNPPALSEVGAETTQPESEPIGPVQHSSDPSMSQLPSVSQLTDVQPTDWAYQALQSLVERYACIVGYPDQTFQGGRSVTRYEFAAGVNACIDRISDLIAKSTENAVSRADLQTLQRLQDEFANELATLRGRVDTLQARTDELEAQQFSTTTVMGGEVIFGLADAFGGGPPGDGDANPIFGYAARLQLVTSFTGKDRLRAELEMGDFINGGFVAPQALNTLTALTSFQVDSSSDDTRTNHVQLSLLEYRFPAFDDRVVFTIKPAGFSLSSVLTANSPFFSDSEGSISRFGQLSPLFRIGNLDAGIGLDWLINSRLRFQFAMGAKDASNANKGFFGAGSHALGAQLLFLPANNLQMGLAFINGYSPAGRLDTYTGSAAADASGFIDQPAQIYALNATLQWDITPTIVFATWGGIVGTYVESISGGAISTTYLASLGFRDPFGRRAGDLLGILFGQPLRLLSINGTTVSTGAVPDNNTASYHIEVFYRFRVNDNISITPGVFLVTNPGNYDSNNTIYVGVIRTTFRF